MNGKIWEQKCELAGACHTIIQGKFIMYRILWGGGFRRCKEQKMFHSMTAIFIIALTHRTVSVL